MTSAPGTPPFDPIGAVEDAIVGAVKAKFGNTLRLVDTAPAVFSAGETKDRLRLAPGVYVAFLGGQPVDWTEATLSAQFAVYVLTSNMAGEKPRRRGDVTAIGAYPILAVLIPLLNTLVVPDVGPLQLQAVTNLYAEALNSLGLTLYAAAFRIEITFPSVAAVDLSTLGNFATFDGQWIVPPLHQVPPATIPVHDGEQRPEIIVPLPGPYGLGPDGTATLPIGAT